MAKKKVEDDAEKESIEDIEVDGRRNGGFRQRFVKRRCP